MQSSKKMHICRTETQITTVLISEPYFFPAMFSQLNSSHMLHFSTPRISSPILRTMSPIAYLSIHPDPLKEAGLPRSQSAESHSSSSRSTGRRQLPVIPCGNKFPPSLSPAVLTKNTECSSGHPSAQEHPFWGTLICQDSQQLPAVI